MDIRKLENWGLQILPLSPKRTNLRLSSETLIRVLQVWKILDLIPFQLRQASKTPDKTPCPHHPAWKTPDKTPFHPNQLQPPIPNLPEFPNNKQTNLRTNLRRPIKPEMNDRNLPIIIYCPLPEVPMNQCHRLKMLSKIKWCSSPSPLTLSKLTLCIYFPIHFNSISNKQKSIFLFFWWNPD